MDSLSNDVDIKYNVKLRLFTEKRVDTCMYVVLQYVKFQNMT